MGDADIFRQLYMQNGWGDPESRSGNGSTLRATAQIRRELPVLLRNLGIRSLLDIPCGDFNWIEEIAAGLEQYIGADIVPELIEDNKRRHPHAGFEVLDITKDNLPKVDLVLVRDLFGHLPRLDVVAALDNIKYSGSRYLLATTWPGFDDEEPPYFHRGLWRHVNLEQGYNLGEPEGYLIDGFELEDGSHFDSKRLGLWRN